MRRRPPLPPRTHVWLQGYLAHKKTHPPLGWGRAREEGLEVGGDEEAALRVSKTVTGVSYGAICVPNTAIKCV